MLHAKTRPLIKVGDISTLTNIPWNISYIMYKVITNRR